MCARTGRHTDSRKKSQTHTVVTTRRGTATRKLPDTPHTREPTRVRSHSVSTGHSWHHLAKTRTGCPSHPALQRCRVCTKAQTSHLTPQATGEPRRSREGTHRHDGGTSTRTACGAQQIRQNYDSPELQFQPSPQTGQQSALGASAAWDGRCASAGEKTAAPRKAGQGGDRPPLRPLISAATCSRRFGGARIAAKAATRSPHPTLHAQPPPPKEVLCSLSLSLSRSRQPSRATPPTGRDS